MVQVVTQRPIKRWDMGGGGTARLYRFENGYGAMVTDCSEYGVPDRCNTVKLVEFSKKNAAAWWALMYFRSHLSDAQVDAILDRIQKGEITE